MFLNLLVVGSPFANKHGDLVRALILDDVHASPSVLVLCYGYLRYSHQWLTTIQLLLFNPQ